MSAAPDYSGVYPSGATLDSIDNGQRYVAPPPTLTADPRTISPPTSGPSAAPYPVQAVRDDRRVMDAQRGFATQNTLGSISPPRDDAYRRADQVADYQGAIPYESPTWRPGQGPTPEEQALAAANAPVSASLDANTPQTVTWRPAEPPLSEAFRDVPTVNPPVGLPGAFNAAPGALDAFGSRVQTEVIQPGTRPSPWLRDLSVNLPSGIAEQRAANTEAYREEGALDYEGIPNYRVQAPPEAAPGAVTAAGPNVGGWNPTDWIRNNITDPLMDNTRDDMVFGLDTSGLTSGSATLGGGTPSAPAAATAAGPPPQPGDYSPSTIPAERLAAMPSDELDKTLNSLGPRIDSVTTRDNGVLYLPGDDSTYPTPIGFLNKEGTAWEVRGSEQSLDDFWKEAAAAGRGDPDAGDQGTAPTVANDGDGTLEPGESSDRHPQKLVPVEKAAKAVADVVAPAAAAAPAKTTKSTKTTEAAAPTTYDTPASPTTSRNSPSRRSSRTQARGEVDDFFDQDGDGAMTEDDFLFDYDDDGKITSKDRALGKRAFAAAKKKRRSKRKGTSTSTIPQRPDSPMRTQILETLNTSMNKKKRR
jgi:hypothetical protein